MGVSVRGEKVGLLDGLFYQYYQHGQPGWMLDSMSRPILVDGEGRHGLYCLFLTCLSSIVYDLIGYFLQEMNDMASELPTALFTLNI